MSRLSARMWEGVDSARLTSLLRDDQGANSTIRNAKKSTLTLDEETLEMSSLTHFLLRITISRL